MSIKCYFHSQRDAVDFCDKCSKPLCEECNINKDKHSSVSICRECSEKEIIKAEKKRVASEHLYDSFHFESFRSLTFINFIWLILLGVIFFEIIIILFPGSSFLTETSSISTQGLQREDERLMQLAMPLQHFYTIKGKFPQFYDDLVPHYIKKLPGEIKDSTIVYTYQTHNRVTINMKNQKNGILLDGTAVYRDNDRGEPFFDVYK
ncbi:MAG: hypothetical protein JXA60_11185 [Candidatus Coatesbacteria bacterium]|nr:hypothetical protein [Candidatus Coatesbacteria bacterium]